MNGFHDAANSIATVVSTGVLKPYQAVVLAAFFNFVAVFVFHLSVATTVGKGIVTKASSTTIWCWAPSSAPSHGNIITWYYGIPSSSSHALIGGIVGAGVAKAGTWALIPAGLLKTVAFIFISPLMGFVIGSLLLLTIRGCSCAPRQAASIACSAGCSSSHRPCTASAMAATMRRKPSASSGCC